MSLGAGKGFGMAKQEDGSEWKTSTRGEQAWKEERERIASRNADTRRSGKQERETYERNRETARNEALAKRRAESLRRRTPEPVRRRSP
jgi:hypothetical protein